MPLEARFYHPEPRILLNGTIGEMTFAFYSMTVQEVRELRDALTQVLEEVENVHQPV